MWEFDIYKMFDICKLWLCVNKAVFWPCGLHLKKPSSAAMEWQFGPLPPDEEKPEWGTGMRDVHKVVKSLSCSVTNMVMTPRPISLFHQKPKEPVETLNLGVEAIMDWIRAKKLKLNPDKTETLLVDSSLVWGSGCISVLDKTDRRLFPVWECFLTWVCYWMARWQP